LADVRNVIWIVLDTVRADHVGAYAGSGALAMTPHLDALAQESLLFEQVVPESMPTLCIRRALHTGRRTFPFKGYRVQKGDLVRLPGWQAIPETQPTAAEILQRAGFRTALITDTYHCFKPSMNFHRGFVEYRWIRGQEADYATSAPPRNRSVDAYMVPQMKGRGVEMLLGRYLGNIDTRRVEEDHFGPQVFRSAMEWLEMNADADRFFLCIDSFDPHEPWDPPSHYVYMYDPGYEGTEVILPMYGKADYLTQEQLRHVRALYAGEVTMVDRWLGELIACLERLRLLDSTLLVVASDHGHSIGEHGLIGKIPWGQYPELMDSVCLVRHPAGQGAGERRRGYVAHHDILPTTLAALGVEPPASRLGPMDGIDLLGTGTGLGVERDHMTSAFKDYASYRDDKHLFIAHFSGEDRRLYVLDEDPAMERNVAEDRAELADELFRAILADAGGELPVYSDPRSSEEGEWYQPSPWSFDDSE